MSKRQSDLDAGDSKRPRIDDPSDCPYLDSIVRQNLDFDFEKVCSVSLSNLNVYACLVCGKYFQGRGKSSQAYFHSMDADHHVFMNLKTLKAYCLPDGYEIKHSSLSDIQYVARPKYTVDQVKELDHKSIAISYDLNGKQYTPGFVGLNNIKQNDYMNVVIQALAHVKPIRNFFLLQNLENSSELVQRFGLLVKKIWNPRLFKGQVSPHEFLQEVSNASKNKFRIDKQGDPMQFLTWLLNELHRDLSRDKKSSTAIFDDNDKYVIVIHRTFQGEICSNSISGNEPSKITPFLFLTLELPPASLFLGDNEQAAIPQVALEELLKKYDGITQSAPFNQRNTSQTYAIRCLPQFLILCIKRFGKNEWALEKNPTITNFSPKSLIVTGENETSVYSLVANISHEGKPDQGKGTFKVHISDKKTHLWYSIQDLIIEETLPQMISLTETYIQIWSKRSQTLRRFNSE